MALQIVREVCTACGDCEPLCPTGSIKPFKGVYAIDARAAVLELQPVLADAPPPWLAKVMGHATQARVRFAVEGEA